MKKNLKPGTLCVQAGWQPKNGESRVVPIVQSTTFKYDDSDEMAMLFDLKKEGYFYTRLLNPTCDAVAKKIAALEGGIGAMLTSSGQAANFYAVFNICSAGDHFVTSNEIYGGTYNLFGVTLKKLGIECTFVDQEASEEEIQAAKNMTAYEYLRTHQAQRLQKTRTRNEWQLTDHDSFKINELSSKWHWKSRDIGGVSALRFLIEVDGMKFTDAVKLLCEESPSFLPIQSVEKEKPPFKLPERFLNCRRIRAYLNHRGISDAVITYCISQEILYESVPYHNAVFVGKDESGKARYRRR